MGLKENLLFLQFTKPLPPFLVVPTSRLPSRETLEGGGIITQHGLPPPETQILSPSDQAGAKEYSKV